MFLLCLVLWLFLKTVELKTENAHNWRWGECRDCCSGRFWVGSVAFLVEARTGIFSKWYWKLVESMLL
jgi:hypothetical protein